MTPFADRLNDAVNRLGSPACVGLDPHLDRLPAPLVTWTDQPMSPPERHALQAMAALTFCRGVLEAVDGVVPSVKPQVAFFEALGAPGVVALQTVVAEARERGLVVVLDAKRGDIGSTARAYARATLADDGPLAADSVTLSPYLGPESLEPFLPYTERGAGVFVLVRTSNPGAEGWQRAGSAPVADAVAAWIRACNQARLGGSGLGPVGAVIGATLPLEAPLWRQAMPNAWFLVPGYGAQGASAADCRGHLRADGRGALVVSARGVLYPPAGRAGADWVGDVRRRAVDFAQDLRENLVG